MWQPAQEVFENIFTMCCKLSDYAHLRAKKFSQKDTKIFAPRYLAEKFAVLFADQTSINKLSFCPDISPDITKLIFVFSSRTRIRQTFIEQTIKITADLTVNPYSASRNRFKMALPCGRHFFVQTVFLFRHLLP